MSEPKLISPMLDHFNMGDPISERKGVRCCPAMEHFTDAKYIVKIISVPADPTRLDALLLSGAYQSKEEALSYYSMLADDIMGEVKLLEKLSQLDGFIPFDGCQVTPMDDGNGYDVYLLSSYGTTLQKRMRNGTLTHLEALNLGLDLCAALTVARRSGYLYVDLKPSNIFITTERGYRIGDLGFIKLDGLKYASLPERYRTAYTAPEITDAYSSLNSTLDVYAVGLILYQVFNNGALPFTEENAPAEAFPAPAYADYEMSEIILKACALDPEQRWQDPVDLGKALVDYMQRNGAHDTPIIPTSTNEAPDEVVTDVIEEEAQVGAFEATEAIENEITDSTEEVSEITTTIEDDTPEITEDSIFIEDAEGNLTFLDDADNDETLPTGDSEQIEYDAVSDELSDILQQADELIAHETPDPVVQPEAVDVPIPPPIDLSQAEEEQSEEASATSDEEADSDVADTAPEAAPAEEATAETEDIQTNETEDEPAIPTDSDEDDEEDAPPRRAGRWIRNILLILLAAAIIAFGFYYYKNYYLQPIESIVLEESSDGTLTVYITTNVDESKLTVVCSDTYGNKLVSAVTNGKAVFTGLPPNSAYTVKVDTTGFHRLTGDTSKAYTTPVQTNVVQFTAVTGAEEGSIILGFAIDGPDADQWCVSYIADDGNVKEMSFAGHTVTLTGFTVGNSYTFTLKAADGQTVTGNTEVTYTASKLVKAESLMITGCNDNALTAVWSAPADTTVESWTVRCYSEGGFDETIVTSETTATFTINDPTASYTVEVTAGGMSVSERTYAAANSLTVTNFRAEPSGTNSLTLLWDCAQEVPQDGWKILYTIDGSTTQEISCTENSTSIPLIIPGATYRFNLQPADGSAVLGGILSYTAPEAVAFSGFGTSAEKLEMTLCCPPSYEGWDYWDVPQSDYRNEFAIGEKGAFVVRNHGDSESGSESLSVMFVVQDENGTILDISANTYVWEDLWSWSYCEFEIPYMPQAAGNYTITVYFNGGLVNSYSFMIVAE